MITGYSAMTNIMNVVRRTIGHCYICTAVLLLMETVVGRSFLVVSAAKELVLSERIMRLSKISAELSALAYHEDPLGNSYDSFGFYDAEPDQALVARKNGYCFGAFRGTTLTWDDWQQNLRFGTEEICPTKAEGAMACCNTRSGFWEAYNTEYRDAMEKSLRECASECINKDECVVLTGHSQGGAIAAVAAVSLSDLNPYVFTFGQPPTIDAPCPLITSERWYRYINTKAVESGLIGIAYDPVPFAPSMGMETWGHMILLGDDAQHVAYVGLDAQDEFSPLNIHGFESHSMVHANGTTYPGYLDRLQAIIKSYDSGMYGTYPVVTSGFPAGSLCTQDVECAFGDCGKETGFSFYQCVGKDCKADADCEMERCDSGVCVPKLGSCQVCNEHSDCKSGYCSSLFRCGGENGLMDDDCVCIFNSDCRSGRCEGLKPRICEAKLADGAYCNESQDCLSNYCSWKFRCEKSKSWWDSHTTSATLLETSALHSIEVDSLDRGAFDQSAGEEQVLLLEIGGNDLKAPIIIAVAAFLVIGLGRWLYQRKRRYGYEQVPAELVV